MLGNKELERVGEKELRAMHCELNCLSRSDGAAIFAQGSTCVVSAVLGPVEVKQQNLKIEGSYIECNFRPKSGLPTLKDKIRESLVREACEAAIFTAHNPRSMISIQIQELEDRCGLEACAINGACLALLVASAPMNFSIAAVHCIITKDGNFILDPDHYEFKDIKNSFTFVFDSINKDIVTIQTSGCFKMPEFTTAEKMCRDASDKIFDFYRTTLSSFHPFTSIVSNNDNQSESME